VAANIFKVEIKTRRAPPGTERAGAGGGARRGRTKRILSFRGEAGDIIARNYFLSPSLLPVAG